eukprot:TRINITY_DN103715_c0_g1_i1.p1 TRINITY_DN103715_c0_g1~~TRINITY_DN103715_c0_g1_i1.p1  ORF type:complete len:384 (-),score=48.17 TRINITY_DN103715_c0_g1_i1:66-1112(-)
MAPVPPAVNQMAGQMGAQMGAAAAKQGIQSAKDQIAAIPPGGSDGFLYCIPVFPGAATPHAISMKYCLRRILALQFFVCCLRIVLLRDILGGVWMLFVIFVGSHGYWEYMNMTYLSCWGVLCLINGFIDTLHCILPIVFGLLSIDILTVLVNALCPLVYLLGATFAYHLYLDYAAANKIPLGSITYVIPDVFWVMKQKMDAAEHEHLPLSMQKMIDPTSPEVAPGTAAVPPPGYGAPGTAPGQSPYGYSPQAPQQQPPPAGAASPGGGGGAVEKWFEHLGAQAGAHAAQSAVQQQAAQAQAQAGGFGSPQAGFGAPGRPAGMPPPPPVAAYPQQAPAGRTGAGRGWFG